MTEKENKLMVMLKSDNVKERFVETVGPHGGAWITSIINAANLNPTIWECEPVSVITAGLNAATLRLSLDPSTGQAAILPFNTKVNGKYIKKAVFVPMVRGLKQLALRTGQYRYINATQVYEGEEIREDRMSGIQYLEGKRTSDDVIGYYAAFELMNGYQSTIYMPVGEIMEHAERYSPSFDKRNKKFYPNSLWIKDFPAMAKKTVLRLLLMRDGLLDPGVRDVLDSLDTGDGDLIDQDFIDDEEIIDVDPTDIDEEEVLQELGF